MPRDALPPAQRRILEWLAHPIDEDHDGELVCSQGEAWIGTDRFSMRPVYGLLRLMLIRDASQEVRGELQRYVINSTGRQLLAGAVTVGELRAVTAARRPFSSTRRGLRLH